MAIVRRRLLFWLIQAYLKRWGKTIVLSFLIGIALFFSLRFLAPHILAALPTRQEEIIGIVGSPTLATLPGFITDDISYGLTIVGEDGKTEPGIAKSWKIEDDGKKYTFFLRSDLTFSDGSKLTSADINYSFADVTTERPNENTIVFSLKDSYAPFLITVSRPLFKQGFIGVGEYKLKKASFNGDFIEYVTLVSQKNNFHTKTYQFYPTPDAVKTAYALGEVKTVLGLPDSTFLQTDFTRFTNTTVEKVTNYDKLVTLFYNTKDPVLSDNTLRDALSYAIPDTFSQGERNYTPYPPTFWANNEGVEMRMQDFRNAELLLSTSDTKIDGALKLELKTMPKYRKTAEEIAAAFKQINIDVQIEEVNTLPTTFQMFLGDFSVSKDPDQYVLWHSTQVNNITRYDNKRIDKLLEDGRKIINYDERQKLYADFQKYLLDDVPASFLFFPYEYKVTRK